MSFQRLHRLLALTAAGGALGAIALSATPASANVEFGVTAGPHMFSPNNELGVADEPDADALRNSVLFGIRLGITFTDVIGVELEGGVIPTEGQPMVFDVWAITARAHLIMQFRAANPANQLIPFIVFGGGIMNVADSDREELIYKDTDEMIYGGIGAKFRVEGGWGLRFDLRGIGVPSSEDEGGAFDAEALLSVYKEWGRKAAPKPEVIVEEEPEPVTNGDADGDGLMDDVDQCMNEAEDADGYQDDDGCPDPDNDGDGVADSADNCDDQKEDPDGYQDEDGCPDTDNDGDGMLDESDRCPNEAEDMDGFQDDDGCPELDNDGDGVLDANDMCQDGPKMMETKNGYKDRDGCADEIPKAVKKFTGVIKGITFKTDSAEILKSSNKTLDAAVKLLQEYSDLNIEIQGHTDDVGDRDHNMTLSQQRAESVKAYMVLKGLDETRIVAKGYGPDAPKDPKTTKAARAKNRRVEFKLISELDAVAPPANAPPADDGN